MTVAGAGGGRGAPLRAGQTDAPSETTAVENAAAFGLPLHAAPCGVY